MNCFPCFSSQKGKKENGSRKDIDFKRDNDISFDPQPQPSAAPGTDSEGQLIPCDVIKEALPAPAPADYGNNTSIKTYNFRELLSATRNFRQECLLGEGGLGKVYKGTLQGQVVAVKQLDRNAMEGSNEFFVEVSKLSLLQHPNLVSLIGYCADGDQRLLVYEFLSGGSLEDHLHGTRSGGKTLDWVTRMKIAYGAAQGLQYLHEKAKPAVMYRDLKSSKVLTDEDFNPKLSNIGLDKLAPPTDSKMPMQSTMMEDHGYNAPEYTSSGTVTPMTDVYSFGVILLELITGRKPIDTSKPEGEQNLIAWAQPLFKEPKHFPDMADPLLKKQFPERALNQAVAIAAMCVQEEAAARPLISDLASVLSFLSIATEQNNIPATLPPTISSKLSCISEKLQFLDCNDQSGKLQTQESNVNANNDESDEDEDDEESAASSSGDEQAEGDGKGNPSSLSQENSSSGRSLFSISSKSGREVSSKKSKKSLNYSSGDEKDNGRKSAASSSGVDLTEAAGEVASSSTEKINMKSRKASSESIGRKSIKKLGEKISKSRKRSKKKKSKEENESSSGATKKKKSHKDKKRSDDEN